MDIETLDFVSGGFKLNCTVFCLFVFCLIQLHDCLSSLAYFKTIHKTIINNRVMSAIEKLVRRNFIKLRVTLF